MSFQISRSTNPEDKQVINDQLYYFNLAHFSDELKGRYEEIKGRYNEIRLLSSSDPDK